MADKKKKSKYRPIYADKQQVQTVLNKKTGESKVFKKGTNNG